MEGNRHFSVIISKSPDNCHEVSKQLHNEKSTVLLQITAIPNAAPIADISRYMNSAATSCRNYTELTRHNLKKNRHFIRTLEINTHFHWIAITTALNNHQQSTRTKLLIYKCKKKAISYSCKQTHFPNGENSSQRRERDTVFQWYK